MKELHCNLECSSFPFAEIELSWTLVSFFVIIQMM